MTKRKDSSRYEPTKHQYINRDKRSGFYYFRGTINGKFIDKSLRAKTIDLARSRAQKVIAKAMGADVSYSKFRHTFDEAFDLLLKIKKARSKKTYVEARTQIENHLRPWFSKNCKHLDEFEMSYEEKWAEYKIFQKAKNPKRKLTHDKKVMISVLYRATTKGWLKRSFKGRDLELKEASEPIGKYIEREELKAIASKLREHEKIFLQFEMALYMGMRKSEVLGLRIDEIRDDRDEIALDPNRLKIRKPRGAPIPIPAPLVFRLRELKRRAISAGGIYIFPSGDRSGKYPSRFGQKVDWSKHQVDNGFYWDKLREELKLEVRWHDLRHTAITNLLSGGMGETAVEKITGASRDVIKRIYAHINVDIKNQFHNIVRGIYVESGDRNA